MSSIAILREVKQLYNESDRLDSLADQHPVVSEESPYERLLTDAMHGDKLLFVREDVVEAAWSVVDPVLNNVIRLGTYNSGTWGPEEADRLAADVGGWSNPEP
jgi:glucose-6-phosphate 1-dehydrogenase